MPILANDEGFVYFQVAFVRGLIIVGAMDSTGFGSNLYPALPNSKTCGSSIHSCVRTW